MKRFFLILCILSFPILLFGQWVDTGGSTWTATDTSVQEEIKDIQNDVHDRANNAWRITGSTVNVIGTVSVTTPPIEESTATLKGGYASQIQYYKKVSSGTSGKITATTSSSISLPASSQVYYYSFLYLNGNDLTSEGTVEPTYTGTDMIYVDGMSNESTLPLPINTDFNVTLQKEATFYYEIRYLE